MPPCPNEGFFDPFSGRNGSKTAEKKATGEDFVDNRVILGKREIPIGKGATRALEVKSFCFVHTAFPFHFGGGGGEKLP